ncbi:hypothetical protein RFI_39081 [Reticulomyxa filosa]|uniref:Cation-transporting P-type ATPase C-terminal domain-containing protein n=1 Tax=Reticulomyxa filosa TaxID=46433 RepID=X6LBD1_RETFI|nr:hypothetical protein RFI_39081 [Reticulomyxa filosa]|eukprot:ETN98421.1 hypothetical protein RFI_39081 [Reticulomyxa filosa]
MLIEFASEGLRCLGISFKYLHTKQLQIDNNDYSQVESNLAFVGVVSMLNPHRSELKDAIRIYKIAGIHVIVITEEFYHEIGLFGVHEDLNGKLFTGNNFMELFNMQPYCVNDASDLKNADIGIGMSSGIEVAKHAADMIFADDNFATIMSALEEGIAIYSNNKQFICYLISSNIVDVVFQLLWFNLITDGLSANALGFNKHDQDIMTRPSRCRTEKIINRLISLVLLVILLL